MLLPALFVSLVCCLSDEAAVLDKWSKEEGGSIRVDTFEQISLDFPRFRVKSTARVLAEAGGDVVDLGESIMALQLIPEEAAVHIATMLTQPGVFREAPSADAAFPYWGQRNKLLWSEFPPTVQQAMRASLIEPLQAALHSPTHPFHIMFSDARLTRDAIADKVELLIRDIFVQRYQPNADVNPIHTDRAELSLSCALTRNHSGSHLFFPRQRVAFMLDQYGACVAFPGGTTHPHLVTPTVGGTRLALVLQTRPRPAVRLHDHAYQVPLDWHTWAVRKYTAARSLLWADTRSRAYAAAATDLTDADVHLARALDDELSQVAVAIAAALIATVILVIMRRQPRRIASGQDATGRR